MGGGDRNGIRRTSRAMAVCGLTAALSLVLMTVGSAFGVLTYVCPMLAGFLLLGVREKFGVRYALTLWAAIGLLAAMLVPEAEMAALFLGVFGWYPAAKPALDKFPGLLSWTVKLLTVNGAALLVYGGLFFVLGLETGTEGPLDWAVLLILANLVFFCYDRCLDRLRGRLTWLVRRWFKRL